MDEHKKISSTAIAKKRQEKTKHRTRKRSLDFRSHDWYAKTLAAVSVKATAADTSSR